MGGGLASHIGKCPFHVCEEDLFCRQQVRCSTARYCRGLSGIMQDKGQCVQLVKFLICSFMLERERAVVHWPFYTVGFLPEF